MANRYIDLVRIQWDLQRLCTIEDPNRAQWVADQIEPILPEGYRLILREQAKYVDVYCFPPMKADDLEDFERSFGELDVHQVAFISFED